MTFSEKFSTLHLSFNARCVQICLLFVTVRCSDSFTFCTNKCNHFFCFNAMNSWCQHSPCITKKSPMHTQYLSPLWLKPQQQISFKIKSFFSCLCFKINAFTSFESMIFFWPNGWIGSWKYDTSAIYWKIHFFELKSIFYISQPWEQNPIIHWNKKNSLYFA